MPKTSTSDDITQRLFGELFQEMHVEMNPRQTSSSEKPKTSGTTLEADGVSSESSNMSDCPTPRYHALTPIKYGYLIKQGHNFRNWKKRLCAVEGNYLYYYVHEDDMAPRGVILLDNCSVREEPQLAKERKTNCFSLQASRSWNVSNARFFPDRKFYFCLNSSSDLGDWVALLQSVATGMPRYAHEDLF